MVKTDIEFELTYDLGYLSGTTIRSYWTKAFARVWLRSPSVQHDDDEYMHGILSVHALSRRPGWPGRWNTVRLLGNSSYLIRIRLSY